MEKEFNLSRKRIEGIDYPSDKYYLYKEKDVKEFIKRLKEITKRNSGCEYMLNWEEIDKLAGDKLIGTNHPTPDLNEDGEVIGYS